MLKVSWATYYPLSDAIKLSWADWQNAPGQRFRSKHLRPCDHQGQVSEAENIAQKIQLGTSQKQRVPHWLVHYSLKPNRSVLNWFVCVMARPWSSFMNLAPTMPCAVSYTLKNNQRDVANVSLDINLLVKSVPENGLPMRCASTAVSHVINFNMEIG